jgi:translation initiation factor eIF-2B subunit alpha/methylthioribose-1-phosphate isomerase
MLVNGKECRSLWWEKNSIKFIDQRKLPYEFDFFSARTVDEVAFAIKNMVVRGAPAIGASAAYGMVLGENRIEKSASLLRATRPTANDLFYAINFMLNKINHGEKAIDAANEYVDDIINSCKKIGENGEKLIKDGMKILTHCNAGALATVDYGTALAPFRLAFRNGKKFLIFADETRPRLQGLLTAWELKHEGIEHVVIADNAAGYFMKTGAIDLVITGADRIAENGDFANKIGTYEKAVLASENKIPFYVAAPISTFDKSIPDGSHIVIEERMRNELSEFNGNTIMPEWIKVKNPAFDVTPVDFVTGYITENGIITK